eukprot:6065680-Prymnesium_polylepis.3
MSLVSEAPPARSSKAKDPSLDACPVEVALVLEYTCALLVKTCGASVDVCASFGLGDTAEGAQ